MIRDTVIVIGAGPTGMTAAALLARYGVPVLVFEREADILAIPRAVHLDEEVLRGLHLSSLGREVAREIRPIRGMQLVDRERRTLVSFEREGEGLHGFARSNAFDQPELERAMRRALTAEPRVTLRSGVEVEAVEHLASGRLRVTVRVRASGELETYEAPAVLACDGARSRARTFVGTELEDLGFDARWLVVDVRTDAPLDLYDGCLQVADPERPTTYFCTGAGRHRWEIMLAEDETADVMTQEDRVRALLRPWLGDATNEAELRRRAVYTFHSLVAHRWRRGNLFLLGDAAHQTPPFIGQGMGAGVRDAVNLAWKLAAVLAGRASPALLDTYERERRPHVRSVIAQAVLLGKTMRTTLGGSYREAILQRVGAVEALHRWMVGRAFPPLVRGPMVGAPGARTAGDHAPRARVEHAGQATDLDAVLGDDFALLTLEDRGSVPSVRIRRLRDGAEDVVVADTRGTLAAWFAARGAESALVRPDRVVMASGAANAAPRWLEALERACGWRAA